MRTKAVVFLLCIFLITTVGAARAEQQPVYGGTLRAGLEGEPPGLDPTINPAAIIDRVVYNNLFEGLVKFNRDGKIVPALAEKVGHFPGWKGLHFLS